jgi:hypothetical protein
MRGLEKDLERKLRWAGLARSGKKPMPFLAPEPPHGYRQCYAVRRAPRERPRRRRLIIPKFRATTFREAPRTGARNDAAVSL